MVSSASVDELAIEYSHATSRIYVGAIFSMNAATRGRTHV